MCVYGDVMNCVSIYEIKSHCLKFKLNSTFFKLNPDFSIVNRYTIQVSLWNEPRTLRFSERSTEEK